MSRPLTSNRRGKFKILGITGEPLSLSLSGKSWSSHKEHPEECERVFSLKAINLQHARLTMERDGEIFRGVQSIKYPSISRKKVFKELVKLKL